MSRIHRLRTSDRIFFVTANLSRGLGPLANHEYSLLLGALAESRRKLRFLLHGYVLMPDHWHALIWTAYPLTISQAVKDIKWNSARALNRSRGLSGTVWQHQFWDRFVRHAREFDDRLTYMHLNPVRNGLVAKPEDWPWSSYNNFAPNATRVAESPIQIDYISLSETYRG